MIRHIVALDSERGMAKGGAMPPWKLSKDEQYFTDETLKYGGNVLMGRKTFVEALQNKPLAGRSNYVVTRDPSAIPGVTVVNDLASFMADWPLEKDLWVIGGSEVFVETMHDAHELYITEIDGMYGCDKFYPAYKSSSELLHVSPPQLENGISYQFCVYRPKNR